MAMIARGVEEKMFRASTIKAYTVSYKTAYAYLEKIVNETKPTKEAVISQQMIASHSLDNYQQYHPYGTQRDGHAGLYHTGMVYNMVMIREYNKPVGSIVVDSYGGWWVVTSSLLVDSWHCQVKLRQIDDPTRIAQERAITDELSTITILPNLHWKIHSFPMLQPQTSIT